MFCKHHVLFLESRNYFKLAFERKHTHTHTHVYLVTEVSSKRTGLVCDTFPISQSVWLLCPFS